jgi:hypothetical protein
MPTAGSDLEVVGGLHGEDAQFPGRPDGFLDTFNLVFADASGKLLEVSGAVEPQ